MKAVVLTFDRLPAYWLSCYGNPSAPTPNCDALAAQSIVFDEHFTENVDSSARNHAWWTGCYQFPRSHDAQLHFPNVFSAFQGHQIETALFVEKSDQDGSIPLPAFSTASSAEPKRSSVRIFEAATTCELIAGGIDCINGWQGENVASWLLWLKASGITVPSASSQLISEATQPVDESIGRLWQFLSNEVEHDDLLLVVTAGRGADGSFSTADGNADRSAIRDSILHVPLFLYLGGVEMGGRRSELTQPVDLVPTLLEWLGMDSNTLPNEGHSVLTCARSKAHPGRGQLFFGDGLRTIGTATEDCLLRMPGQNAGPAVSRDPEMFIKPDDRFEIHDVARQEPDIVDELVRTLTDFVEEHHDSSPVPFNTTEHDPTSMNEPTE